MYGKNWKTSERKFDVKVEKDVKIPVSDGIYLNCDIFRPSTEGKFPAVLSASPYKKDQGPMDITAFHLPSHPPTGTEWSMSEQEAGEPNFYVRRGYVRVILNVRGTGKSEGLWDFQGKREVQDIYEVIEWIASQEWCDGNVGMLGASYFAMIQFKVAELNPPSLKCIFAPWGSTDQYRDWFYVGGILNIGFLRDWMGELLKEHSNIRPRNLLLEDVGEKEYYRMIEELKKDEDILSDKLLSNALEHPDTGFNPFLITLMAHPLEDEFWVNRRIDYKKIKVPTYMGADWRPYGSHTKAAFRNWENIDSKKRMIIGPPLYLDRPLFQLQYESLRWFDYWLKGNDTKITEGKQIKLFTMGSNRWIDVNEWPLPETLWTPFYIHERGVMSEREYWNNEGSDSFFDSPYGRGSVEFTSPRMVDETEVIGPISLNVYGSSTDDEILWTAQLFAIEGDDQKKLISAGWLRGSHRAMDTDASRPWKPYHIHNTSDPLVPGEVYEFNIEMSPVAYLFKPGTRFSVVISGSDYNREALVGRKIMRTKPSRITVYHNDLYPSNLLLPVVSGNVVGTFISRL